MKNRYQAVIVGAGSAGLAAGLALKEQGIEDVLIIEKDQEPGGILQQCIHNGFGLQTFHEQLSGPSYAERFIEAAKKAGLEILCDTTVTRLDASRTLEISSPSLGVQTVHAGAIILAVGCYERPAGALALPGDRPAGIFTAGQAQRWLNLEGRLAGKRVLILGSGDIGLIMARRMHLEGAEVLGVAELCPYSNGLPRNIKQCLEDFGIPLYLSHTVTRIFGKGRLEAVEISRVDENRRPVAGTERLFEADTLLLSVGLIPENHLADQAGILMNPKTRGPVVDEQYMTSVPGIFACGNGLHVHDLVDFVTLQSKKAGQGAARWLLGQKERGMETEVLPGNGVSYTVPGLIHPKALNGPVEFFFRVACPMEKARLVVSSRGKSLFEKSRTHLMPSEMERLILPASLLQDLEEPLVFEVREEKDLWKPEN